MPHNETLLSRETIYDGPVFAYERWQVELENGCTANREMLRHPGGVALVVMDQADRLLMVRQYRNGAGRETCEIPAGKRDAGETPEECGRRELEEECGLIAGRMTLLATMYPTPAFCDEKLFLYVAEDCTAGTCHPDEDEFITTEWVPFAEALQMVLDDSIQDAKTQFAILKYAALHGKL